MREPPTLTLRVIAFSVVVSAGILLRLWAASSGENYDMESWWIASQALLDGKSIYASTHRYNYGPIWGYVLAGLRHLAQALGDDSMRTLHILVTITLSISDLALALIAGCGSFFRFLLIFLNPISIITTGYHVQFDNLAILIALAAWRLFQRSQTPASFVLAGLVLGSSLCVKHIFSIFLVWLPFLVGYKQLSQRLLYGITALTLFGASFLPWVHDSISWQGIVRNVFQYTSTEGHSLISLASSSTLGIKDRNLFVLLLSAIGLFLTNRPRLHPVAPLLYLIAITGLSSGMARNYLAIPVVAIMSLSPSYLGLPYLAVATLALITVNSSLGTVEVVAQLSSSPLVTYELAQTVLVLLLAALLWMGSPSLEISAPSTKGQHERR
jgi:hypothetical protein